MNDKKRLLVIKLGGSIFVAGIILFLMDIMLYEMSLGPLNPTFFVVLIPAIAIIAILIIVVKKQGKGVKSGMPMHDELSKRIKHSAGYYSYLISIYFLLVIMWYHFLMDDLGLPAINPEHIAIGTMIFMFVVFGISYLIIKRRGIR